MTKPISLTHFHTEANKMKSISSITKYTVETQASQLYSDRTVYSKNIILNSTWVILVDGELNQTLSCGRPDQQSDGHLLSYL